jgi:hypothetical protein
MSVTDSLHTGSKYGVLVVTCAIIGIIGFVFTYEIFNLYGKVFGGASAILFIVVIIGIANSFKDTGYKEYTWEEALIYRTPESAISVCEVKIKDPEHGKIWFQERGKLIVTQVGAFLFYGWPWIRGHKRLVINTISAEDAIGGLIEIESETPPDVTPDCLWINTKKAITLKGNKLLDYQEQKNMVSSYEMVQIQGRINRLRFGADVPALQKTGVTTISMDDLTARDA